MVFPRVEPHRRGADEERPDALRRAIESTVAEAVAQARTTGIGVVARVIFRAADMALFARALPCVLREARGFALALPTREQALCGFGLAHELTLDGGEPLEALAERCSRTPELTAGTVSGLDLPLWLMGAAFDGARRSSASWEAFPSASAWVPQLTVSGGGWVALAAWVEGSSEPARVVGELWSVWTALRAHVAAGEPPPGGAEADVAPLEGREAWCARVAGAVATIRGGELDKVVLARAARATPRTGTRFDAAATFAALCAAHPTSTCFAVRRGDAVFMGATPEMLVRVGAGTLETHAVAGTAARGASSEEDARLERELRRDPKIAREHDIVASALRAQLGAFCRALDVTGEPRLIKLAHVQHLETALRGALSHPTHVLRIAAALHPTPSVGGAPRETARRYLGETEPLDRGWYAGPLGAFDAEGQGTLWVAIRSLLVRDAEALVFAGAGVVADSSPAAEWDETELKLRGACGALRTRRSPA